MNIKSLKFRLCVHIFAICASVGAMIALIMVMMSGPDYVVNINLRGGTVEQSSSYQQSSTSQDSSTLIVSHGKLNFEDMPEVSHPEYTQVGWKLDGEQITQWPVTVQSDITLDVIWDVDLDVDKGDVYLATVRLNIKDGSTQDLVVRIGSTLDENLPNSLKQEQWYIKEKGSLKAINNDYIIIGNTELYNWN